MAQGPHPEQSPDPDLPSEQVEHWADMLATIAAQSGADYAETPTTARQCLWLTAYVECYSAPEACRRAGVKPSTVWAWNRNDPTWRAARELADDIVRETANAEAYRRAIHGVERGIWHRGELVGTERQYSDTLLAMVLKRTDPDGWSGQPKRSGEGDQEASSLVARILKDQEALDAWRIVVERLGLPSPDGATEQVGRVVEAD